MAQPNDVTHPITISLDGSNYYSWAQMWLCSSNVENCCVMSLIQSPRQFKRQMNLMMLLMPCLKIGTTFMLLPPTISYKGLRQPRQLGTSLPCCLGISYRDQNLLDAPRIKSIHFKFLCLHLYFVGTNVDPPLMTLHSLPNNTIVLTSFLHLCCLFCSLTAQVAIPNSLILLVATLLPLMPHYFPIKHS